MQVWTELRTSANGKNAMIVQSLMDLAHCFMGDIVRRLEEINERDSVVEKRGQQGICTSRSAILVLCTVLQRT